jgi:hypothetical protein
MLGACREASMPEKKTVSERAFEQFLTEHALAFEAIPVSTSPRPDYRVDLGETCLFVEVKQLERDDDFGDAQTRTIGDHIRSKIGEAKKQMQFGALQGIPSILLIYNALDLH